MKAFAGWTCEIPFWARNKKTIGGLLDRLRIEIASNASKALFDIDCGRVRKHDLAKAEHSFFILHLSLQLADLLYLKAQDSRSRTHWISQIDIWKDPGFDSARRVDLLDSFWSQE